MDNVEIPPVKMDLPPVETQPVVSQNAAGMPMVQQVNVMPENKKSISSLIKTIAIIVLSLIAVTFIGLFIWMFMQYNEARSDVDGQIATAVAKAKDEQATEDEKEFSNREKYPYKVFAGPVDYGELSFEYPKTWSLFISKDATNGGDYEAYLNPSQVDPISDKTVNALRVSILNKSYDDVLAEYQKFLEKKEKNLSVESISVNGITANLYYGVIPNTELNGYILVFKIRDKTAVIRTDSELFKEDFDKLVQTIKFNA